MIKDPRRHGDLTLIPVSEIPSNAKKFSSGKLNKLALGETTGHSHKLITDVSVDVFELGGDKYFKLTDEAIITHEEHNTITLEPLIYKVMIKKEFDYITKQMQVVRD